MTEFKNNQNVHEHEAFIALWLSKYLFPYVKDTVVPETFELAILLARGYKMPLAPNVLAILYKVALITKHYFGSPTKTNILKKFCSKY